MRGTRGLIGHSPVLAVLVAAVAAVAFASLLAACGRASSRAGSTTGSTNSTGSTGSTGSSNKGRGQMVDGTITVGGAKRTYHLYVPTPLSADKPAPLLIALHGGMGNGLQFRDNSGFDKVADANGFLVVFPDGTPVRAIPNSKVWNAGGCCGRAAEDRDNVDDVAFISALIDKISAEHKVDPRRVFATGHSNGAMLSYRLACRLSDKIAAIAVQSGTLFTQPCQPAQPVSVLHIHGTADHNVPIDGGVGDKSINKATYPSPRASIATLARLDGCASEPTGAVDPHNSDVTTQTWTGCQANTEVQFVTVTGASHAWMGHPSTRLAASGTGAPYMKFDSTQAIWSFLAAHPRQS